MYRIGIDLDGCLFNFLGSLYDYTFDKSSYVFDDDDFSLEDHDVLNRKGIIDSVIEDLDFWNTVTPFPYAKDLINIIYKHFGKNSAAVITSRPLKTIPISTLKCFPLGIFPDSIFYSSKKTSILKNFNITIHFEDYPYFLKQITEEMPQVRLIVPKFNYNSEFLLKNKKNKNIIPWHRGDLEDFEEILKEVSIPPS